VADMYWCIDNLDAIRADVGDSTHSNWSDFLEAGYKKKKAWSNNTFFPKRLALGTSNIWAPFYQGSPENSDDKEAPYFRVSAELFVPMLHTLGKEDISKDDYRRISTQLDKCLSDNVAKVEEEAQMKQHGNMIAESRQSFEAASLAYCVAMAKQIGLFQEKTTSNQVLTSKMKVAQAKVKGENLIHRLPS
jgi:hypothetical protein